VVERFLVALRPGHVQALMEVMAPNVVLIADGGGVVAAVRSPVHGAEWVVALLALGSQQAAFETTRGVAQPRARGPDRRRAV
jgi:hypothetical protein